VGNKKKVSDILWSLWIGPGVLLWSRASLRRNDAK
jgi:hypothetical protein